MMFCVRLRNILYNVWWYPSILRDVLGFTEFLVLSKSLIEVDAGLAMPATETGTGTVPL